MGKVDPYVKVYLMPGNFQVEKTKTQKKNFNPTFNETFTYQLPVVDVPSNTVVLQVVVPMVWGDHMFKRMRTRVVGYVCCLCRECTSKYTES